MLGNSGKSLQELIAEQCSEGIRLQNEAVAEQIRTTCDLTGFEPSDLAMMGYRILVFPDGRQVFCSPTDLALVDNWHKNFLAYEPPEFFFDICGRDRAAAL